MIIDNLLLYEDFDTSLYSPSEAIDFCIGVTEDNIFSRNRIFFALTLGDLTRQVAEISDILKAFNLSIENDSDFFRNVVKGYVPFPFNKKLVFNPAVPRHRKKLNLRFCLFVGYFILTKICYFSTGNYFPTTYL